MNISSMSDEALKSTIARLGKEMTAGSTPMTMAKEKERMIYIKEEFKRGLAGYKSKKKYRRN